MEVAEENGAYILESVNGGEFYEDPNIMWIEVIIIFLFYLLKSNTVLWVNVNALFWTRYLPSLLLILLVLERNFPMD